MKAKPHTKVARDSRLGLAKYAEKYLAVQNRRWEYTLRTRRAVDGLRVFLRRMPRVDELSMELLNAWETQLRISGTIPTCEMKGHRSRLLMIWRFAFERGDNQNPPPLLHTQPHEGRLHVDHSEPEPFCEPLPEYQNRNGQGAVVINGVEHKLSKHGSSESRLAYCRLISEYEASGRAAHFGLPTETLTVKDLVSHYWHHAKRHYGGGRQTEFTTVMAAAKYLGMYHEMLARDFKATQLQAVRMRMHLAGCCRNTCNSGMKRIVRIFRWAVSQGLIPAEVATALATVEGWRKGRCPARESKPVKPATLEQIHATLPYLHPAVRAMVELQVYTSCRPGEVCILRPRDVDRSGEVWVYRPSSHKTQHCGKERFVYIGPKGQDVLRPFLLRPADSYCFSPEEVYRDGSKKGRANRPPRKTPRYPSEVKRVEKEKDAARLRPKKRRPGKCYTNCSYRVAIHRACDANDLPRWSPNQLRHLAATEIRRQFGLEAAQVVLGHAHANVTEVYAERNYALAASVAKEVG